MAAIPHPVPSQPEDVVRLCIFLLGGKPLNLSDVIKGLGNLSDADVADLYRAVHAEKALRNATQANQVVEKFVADFTTALRARKWDEVKKLKGDLDHAGTKDYGKGIVAKTFTKLASEFTAAMKFACLQEKGRGTRAICSVLEMTPLFFDILDQCVIDLQKGENNLEGIRRILQWERTADNYRVVNARARTLIYAINQKADLLPIIKTGTITFLATDKLVLCTIPQKEYIEMKKQFLAEFLKYCQEGNDDMIFTILLRTPHVIGPQTEEILKAAIHLARKVEDKDKARGCLVVINSYLEQCPGSEELIKKLFP